METIIFFVIFFGGIWLLSILFSKISEFIKKKREEIRDRAASEVLANINIEEIIQSYKKKLEHIKYIRIDPVQKAIEEFNEWHGGRDAVLLEKCPKCEDGHLFIRKDKYGKFIGCTKYPKCDYTRNIQKAREEYRKSINEQIVEDIQRAYS